LTHTHAHVPLCLFVAHHSLFLVFRPQHTHKHTHTHTHAHTRLCTETLTNTHTHTHTHTLVAPSSPRTHTHTHTLSPRVLISPHISISSNEDRDRHIQEQHS